MGTVTSTIGTSSRNFSTTALWAASLPANLVTDGNSYVGQCYNDTLFTSAATLGLGGFTTDATHTITLTTAAGQSFRDNANVQTNALAYNQSNGVAFQINSNTLGIDAVSQAFLTISNLQIQNNDGDSLIRIGNGSTYNQSFVENCILTNAQAGGSLLQACATCRNNLIIYKRNDHYANITSGIVTTGSALGLVLINNTIVLFSDFASGVAGKQGISLSITTNVIVENNAIFGWTTGITNPGAGPSADFNGTDVASLPYGSHNQTSLTYTSQFVGTTSSAPDFRLKTGSSLINNAVTDATNLPTQDDIAGTARPQGPAWDIGCWELILAAAGSTAFFNGTGSLSALASIGLTASALFNGTGSLSVNSFIARKASALFNGTGSLSLNTSVHRSAAATFNGTGSLTVNATDIKPGSNAFFNGTGSLSVSATLAAAASAQFNGAGSLTVNATDVSAGSNAIFNGTGSLSVAAQLALAAFASFNGTGSLNVVVTLAEAAFAQFNGAGALTVNATDVPTGSSALFNGTGSLSVLVSLVGKDSAVFNGTGSLTVLAQRVQAASTVFNGTGSLSVTAALDLAGSAVFNGTGSLSVHALAAGSSAFFNGTGNFSITAVLRQTAGAIFAGDGQMFVVIPGKATGAQFNGNGRMCIQAQRFIGSRGATTNIVVMGPGPTKNVVVSGGGPVMPNQ